MASNGELSAIKVLIVVVIVLGVTAFVVFMESAQRRITVNYARRQGGRQRVPEPEFAPAAEDQHVGRDSADLRLALLLFPATASSWFANGQPGPLAAEPDQALTPGEPLYDMILYAGMIISFRVLLHRDRVQLAGNGGQPEAFRRADSGVPAGQGDG